jgi:hypothetical protein
MGMKMAQINSNVEIIIVGTKKSLALDPDEEFKINFNKGEELREDLYDLDDLIQNTIDTAFRNGDVIKSLTIDGVDIIKEEILESLVNTGYSVDEALVDLSRLPQFANADPSDLYDLINLVRSENKD